MVNLNLDDLFSHSDDGIGVFRELESARRDASLPRPDPTRSTAACPGTEEKILMLSARYAAGVGLWNVKDRRGQGVDECELMGAFLGIEQRP